MRAADRSSRILLAGALVSAGVHVAMALGFVRWSEAFLSLADAAPQTAAMVKPPKPPEPKEERSKPKTPEVRLGKEHASDPASMAWLGFEAPNEHQAEQGKVDQAAMTIAAPGPDKAAAGSQAAAEAPADVPPPEATPPAATVAERTPEPEVKAPEAKLVEGETKPVEAERASALTREEMEQPAAERAKSLAESVQRAQKQIEEALARLADAIPAPAARPAEMGPPPPPESANPPPPPPPATAVHPTAEEALAVKAPANPRKMPPPAKSPAMPQNQSEGQRGGGLPGSQADREALAVAIKKAPTVRPGQVLVGEGLEIQTRQPRWTLTTMLTRRPRNATVVITFGRDGKVKRASFVNDGLTTYNTGFEDVDEPLMNAIYGWTAKGKALAEVSPDDPLAGVTIMMTIILGG